MGERRRGRFALPLPSPFHNVVRVALRVAPGNCLLHHSTSASQLKNRPLFNDLPGEIQMSYRALTASMCASIVRSVLAGSQPVSRPAPFEGRPGEDILQDTQEHLAQCNECRVEVSGMQQQTALIRELRAPEGFATDLRPGFYAGVM